MNNESDYLWDKTGEPDPEIQQLEEILGTLRYQPRPLVIPANVTVAGKRSFFRSVTPALAIAATIALLMLGLGLWFGLQKLQKSQPATEARNKKSTPVEGPKQSTSSNDASGVVATSPNVNPKPLEDSHPHRSVPKQSLLAVRARRLRNEELAARKLQEAEVAKDQMMMAFRLVSAKLNYAQKKAQELNQKEPVHNQHKIG
jgi:hypothetical protein